MERKHKGKCPFCNSEMAPEVIEKTLSAEINVNVQLKHEKRESVSR